jgi:hypothetical protein
VLPPFGLLGILDEQIEGFPPLGLQGSEQLLGLLAQGGLGIPPLDQEEGMKPGPVARGLQISRASGAMPPTPQKSKGHDQQADVRVMVPVKVPLQGPEQLVKGGRPAYEAKPGAILLRPPVSGTWIPVLAIQGGWPLLARLSSPSHHLPLKKSVNVRTIRKDLYSSRVRFCTSRTLVFEPFSRIILPILKGYSHARYCENGNRFIEQIY